MNDSFIIHEERALVKTHRRTEAGEGMRTEAVCGLAAVGRAGLSRWRRAGLRASGVVADMICGKCTH